MPDAQYFVFNSVLTKMSGEELIPTMIPAAGIKVSKSGSLIYLTPNVKTRPTFNCRDFEVYPSLVQAKAAFEKLIGKPVRLSTKDKLKLVIDHLFQGIHK